MCEPISPHIRFHVYTVYSLCPHVVHNVVRVLRQQRFGKRLATPLCRIADPTDRNRLLGRPRQERIDSGAGVWVCLDAIVADGKVAAGRTANAAHFCAGVLSNAHGEVSMIIVQRIFGGGLPSVAYASMFVMNVRDVHVDMDRVYKPTHFSGSQS